MGWITIGDELLGSLDARVGNQSGISIYVGSEKVFPMSQYIGYEADNLSYTSSATCCSSGALTRTLYTNGDEFVLSVGDKISEDINGLSIFDGQNRWWYMKPPFGAERPILIGSDGIVDSVGAVCL